MLSPGQAYYSRQMSGTFTLIVKAHSMEYDIMLLAAAGGYEATTTIREFAFKYLTVIYVPVFHFRFVSIVGPLSLFVTFAHVVPRKWRRGPRFSQPRNCPFIVHIIISRPSQGSGSQLLYSAPATSLRFSC